MTLTHKVIACTLVVCSLLGVMLAQIFEPPMLFVVSGLMGFLIGVFSADVEKLLRARGYR